MKIQEDEALGRIMVLESPLALAQGRFPESKEAIDQAIKAFPFHQAAQRLRQDIYGILDRRNDRLGMASDWLGGYRCRFSAGKSC